MSPTIDQEFGGEATEAANKVSAGSESILVVDDEVSLTDIAKEMLTPYGYSVETLNGSVEALDFFRQHSSEIDLVITDMTMPRLTGDQLSIRILAIKPEVPIILCSGRSDRFSDDDIAKLAVRALLSKPVQLKDLIQTVRGVLDGRLKTI